MTSGENWTPGPWRARNNCVFSGETIVASLGFNVRVGSDEDDSNARLCAAAPALYAALHALCSRGPGTEHFDSYDIALGNAHAALAKARGEVQP